MSASAVVVVVPECFCNVPSTDSALEAEESRCFWGRFGATQGQGLGTALCGRWEPPGALPEPWARGSDGSTHSSVPSLRGTVLCLGSIQLCSAGTGFPGR